MASGSGRTLENLIPRSASGELPASIDLVIASRPCRAEEVARAAGIETFIMPGAIDPHTLGPLLLERGIEWVVLAGYLALLRIPPGYEGRVVNIHPALLPDFGGPGMFGERVHRAVLDARRAESGCTVHLCDDRYDTGPILAQSRCAVRADDTPGTLAERVFELERELYPRVLADLFAGRLVPPRRTIARGAAP